MHCVDTRYFGNMEYEEDSVFEFPCGLPGFENEQRFVFIELEKFAPLVFLQSLQTSSLCFLALPIHIANDSYKLAVSAEDLAELELTGESQPLLGEEVLVLALLSMHGEISPSVNLMAPIVVNLVRRRAVQAIRRDSLYSHQHP